MRNVQVNVEHIARVEGHGNVVVNVRNGEIEDLRMEIVESPRFFEVMLEGRPWEDVPHIVPRICGICSISHCMTSLKACETAMGVVVSEQTVLLRKLMLYAEFIQSHILHCYFLAAPDFYRVDSVIPLAATAPDVVVRALKLKKLANDVAAIVGGRHVHPITPTVGGFTHIPTEKELIDARRALLDAWPDFEATVELFKTLQVPPLDRKTELVSLKADDEFALYDGVIYSSVGGVTKVSHYKDQVHEYCVPYSAAKQVFGNGSSYLVGALARVHNNYDQLSQHAKDVMADLGLTLPCTNTFHNNTAQIVEAVHCLDKAVETIDTLLERGLQPEWPEVKVRAGKAAAAVEAPRGILFHEYEFNRQGRIVKANCIIPTGQNLANIENDMRALVPTLLDKSEDDIRLGCEMLVRAYDPCISCATHLMKVEFVDR